MNLYTIEKDYFLLNLNESVGVVDKYNNVGEEIYNALMSVKPILIESGFYLRELNSYKIKNDFFVENITIKYYSYLKDYALKTKNDGGFVPEYEKEHLNKENKLINCSIIFYEKTSDYEIINKDYFMSVFSHEISHAYRYYSILSVNNGLTSDSIKKSRSIYNLSKTAISDDEYYKKVISILKRMFYLIDKDEISAFMNQTYEEMRQKEYINNSNIQNHLGEFRMYRETELLKGLLSLFDNLILTEKGKCACYEFLKYVYGDRFAGKKSIRMFRQKVVSCIDYRINKFFTVVGKAFIDFNRKNNYLDDNKNELEMFIRNLDIIL